MIKAFNGRMPKIAESACIDESAQIIGDIEIGENSIIAPGAVLRADFAVIKIGQNAWVEDNCVVHGGLHDVVIGSNVTIGHGAVVHSKQIGDNVLIGMNATILHGAEIGNNCIIGAAALVGESMKVPDYSFVVGVPGKIKGKVTEKQLSWVFAKKQETWEVLSIGV